LSVVVNVVVAILFRDEMRKVENIGEMARNLRERERERERERWTRHDVRRERERAHTVGRMVRMNTNSDIQ